MKIRFVLIILIMLASCNNLAYKKMTRVEPESVKTFVDSHSGDSVDWLASYKWVVDTLGNGSELPVFPEYFLYDITGDGKPELWVKAGNCQAATKLWVYSAENGHPRKIYSDYGGHTEFFIKGNTLGSATYNSGEGYVNIYSYKRGTLKVRNVSFTTSCEDKFAEAYKKEEQPIVDMWLNCSKEINFIPLE